MKLSEYPNIIKFAYIQKLINAILLTLTVGTFLFVANESFNMNGNFDSLIGYMILGFGTEFIFPAF